MPTRRIAANEQAEVSAKRLKEARKALIPLPTRLFDWIGYPLQKRAFQKLLDEKFDGFPWLADAWGEFLELQAERKALALATKKWPAPEAAATVREAGRRAASAERRARIAEHLLGLYEFHAPWLEELRGEDAEELLAAAETLDPSDDTSTDPARRWLTEAEYKSLSREERFQRALDRYWRAPKTRWQIGKDYERLIGFKYETSGYAVQYKGIVEGLNDLGRDLIASKGNEVEIVQCKNWSKEKTIHEKHIFQLFGTVTAFRIDNPEKVVESVFVTSTNLSERARQFARQLEMVVRENEPLEPYPSIKCNISRRSGEKIYHLPFDQQYDSTVIEEERHEMYVETVAEAEAAGFRRAFKWRGDPES